MTERNKTLSVLDHLNVNIQYPDIWSCQLRMLLSTYFMECGINQKQDGEEIFTQCTGTMPTQRLGVSAYQRIRRFNFGKLTTSGGSSS